MQQFFLISVSEVISTEEQARKTDSESIIYGYFVMTVFYSCDCISAKGRIVF